MSLEQYIVEYLQEAFKQPLVQSIDQKQFSSYTYLKEFLIADATVEHLLNKHFLIGVFELQP